MRPLTAVGRSTAEESGDIETSFSTERDPKLRILILVIVAVMS